jgi:hypothetical protein
MEQSLANAKSEFEAAHSAYTSDMGTIAELTEQLNKIMKESERSKQDMMTPEKIFQLANATRKYIVETNAIEKKLKPLNDKKADAIKTRDAALALVDSLTASIEEQKTMIETHAAKMKRLNIPAKAEQVRTLTNEIGDNYKEYNTIVKALIEMDPDTYKENLLYTPPTKKQKTAAVPSTVAKVMPDTSVRPAEAEPTVQMDDCEKLIAASMVSDFTKFAATTSEKCNNMDELSLDDLNALVLSIDAAVNTLEGILATNLVGDSADKKAKVTKTLKKLSDKVKACITEHTATDATAIDSTKKPTTANGASAFDSTTATDGKKKRKQG